MKKITLYLLFFLFAFSAYSQYYLRGEIKNEKNQLVPFASIYVHSLKKYFYSTGTDGSFGFNIYQVRDSLTITAENYQPLTILVQGDQWQNIYLKATVLSASKNPYRLTSFTTGEEDERNKRYRLDDETYFKLIENDFVQTEANSKTTFSLNINKASYSNVRRFINMQSEVPPDAVRVEELLNYFNLHDQNFKNSNKDFNVESILTTCPWDKKEQLLFLNLSAKQIDLKNVVPAHFVFLIDVSASMDLPNRLDLIKSSFQLFVKNLREIDTVSVITYGEKVEVVLKGASGANKQRILSTIENLKPFGETPGEMGIKLAYQLAKAGYIDRGNNRIILATDGDFNVGESSEKGLEDLMAQQNQAGIYLTILGVGNGNLKDSKLQTLAKKGNGNYFYLDDMKEAEKVFVKELTQTIYAVADNVSMTVQFNPSLVKQYRLIGFDNNREALLSTAKMIEGGEIGSGSSLVVVFEITPTERFVSSSNPSNQLASVVLNYKSGSDHTNKKEIYTANNQYYKIDSVDKAYQFAAAVTMFGLKIKRSKYMKAVNWNEIEELAKVSADRTNYLQNDFLKLIEKSREVYKDERSKKNKWKKYLFF